jgi:hypothetical protein
VVNHDVQHKLAGLQQQDLGQPQQQRKRRRRRREERRRTRNQYQQQQGSSSSSNQPRASPQSAPSARLVKPTVKLLR